MSWLNNSLNTIKGQLTNLAQEVLADTAGPGDDEYRGDEVNTKTALELLTETQLLKEQLDKACEDKDREVRGGGGGEKGGGIPTLVVVTAAAIVYCSCCGRFRASASVRVSACCLAASCSCTQRTCRTSCPGFLHAPTTYNL